MTLEEEPVRLPDGDLADLYRRMVLIRRFEEALSDLFTRNLLGGTSHFCIGQEACAVGVVSAVRATDWLVSNHRGHGHLLARGLSPERVMAELMGKETGYCGGRGGSQHMCAMDLAFLGTNGITAGGIPIAVGAALAVRYRDGDAIVVDFFGDGASNQGAFHEALNMAALWQLPVLFVCENNGYGMSNPVGKSTAGESIAGRASAYGMRGVTCDGMDVIRVRDTVAPLAESVRAGEGPVLLELTTYRYCGHSKNDPRVYRTRDEEDEWQARDCLGIAARRLAESGYAEADLEALRRDAAAEIEEAVRLASEAAPGDADFAVAGVFA